MLKICAQKFVDNLKAKNLEFKAVTDKDGDSLIAFPYEGKVTRIFFSGDDGEYLSMYMVYESVPEDKVTDVILTCNELNSEYKWVTFYVDKDKDIVLHLDAVLSIDSAADEAFELLVRMIRISDDEKTRIMKAIYA